MKRASRRQKFDMMQRRRQFVKNNKVRVFNGPSERKRPRGPGLPSHTSPPMTSHMFSFLAINRWLRYPGTSGLPRYLIYRW